MSSPLDHFAETQPGQRHSTRPLRPVGVPQNTDAAWSHEPLERSGSVRGEEGLIRFDPSKKERKEVVNVLIVDDDAVIRRTLTRILHRRGFKSSAAADAREARTFLEKNEYQLMLVDVSMPGESGLDLIQSVIPDNPDIAIVIVSGISTPDVAQFAFEMGVYGFVVKPFHMNEISINISSALRRRALEIENRHHREKLEHVVAERTSALEVAVRSLRVADEKIRNSQAETIHRLSKAAEFRDNETARHIERMSRYCELIAKRVGLAEERVQLIRLASPLHDIGKIGTPDQILLKPGRLEREEFEIMKQHSQIGYKILTGSGSDLLELAATIAWTHHEKVDGSGYPRGLRGEEIPIEGRIAAVADVFDALTSVRIYKAAMSNEKSLKILEEGRGKHFDSRILDAFLDSFDDAVAIQRAFVDG